MRHALVKCPLKTRVSLTKNEKAGYRCTSSAIFLFLNTINASATLPNANPGTGTSDDWLIKLTSIDTFRSVDTR